MNIYVASSWRNAYQPEVVRALREEGHEVYDFRNPTATDKGFSWSEIDPEWKNWTMAEFIAALNHPVAQSAFKKDMGAMEWADACVMVLPCGKSAHSEMGWFTGTDKLAIIYCPEAATEPELMYKQADHVCASLDDVIAALVVN